MTSSSYRGRGSFLLSVPVVDTGGLLFSDKVLDEVHVLFNDLLRHSRALKTTQECSPRRVNI